MTDDLVERLQDTSATRAKATAHDDPANYLLVVARLSHEDSALMAEAAAALTEARAEIARLRQALRPFAQEHAWGPHSRFKIVLAGPEGDIAGADLDRARAALAPRDAKEGDA